MLHIEQKSPTIVASIKLNVSFNFSDLTYFFLTCSDAPRGILAFSP